VIDVTNPITFTGRRVALVGGAVAIAVSDGIACAAESGALRILDVANPVARLAWNSRVFAARVAIVDSVAYVAEGIRPPVVDISKPSPLDSALGASARICVRRGGDATWPVSRMERRAC